MLLASSRASEPDGLLPGELFSNDIKIAESVQYGNVRKLVDRAKRELGIGLVRQLHGATAIGPSRSCGLPGCMATA